MNAHNKNKQLLKILIGAAWIDGIIQVEEREYLKRMAERHGLSEESDLKDLLSELKPVQPNQCYQWLEEYLGDNPSTNDYQELLETLSALIYSDGDVQMQEAQLLTKLQLLDPAQDSPKSALDKILKTIQKLYKKAVDQKI
ncbi:TerB family tellurite resistance protein [Crocosphaera sp.]|uniref:tellurite resistance TerB family protein n=1 Tax=Crocosphaera sp. TaxID=2729996 RepID=UPI003F28E1C1|nr:TerB family tellurite resistance protein [Crocosphaera sp.]